jgi:hypothetical protein
VRVPIGDEIRSGKVVRRKRELDGTVRGRSNANSILDTSFMMAAVMNIPPM